MDQGTQTSEAVVAGDFGVVGGSGADARGGSEASGGTAVGVGAALARTVRHFWPEFNGWLEALPDTRHQPFVVYDAKFMAWWGLSLFLCKLESRRQLDFDLRDLDTCVLPNVNRLAETDQETLPCHDTLDHFVGHVGDEGFAQLRTKIVRHLIRKRVFEKSRLFGHYVVGLDATGTVVFRKRHCPQCLKSTVHGQTYYMHHVLEAKLITPEGLAFSIGSEFIENPMPEGGATDAEYEKLKQDCELKAFGRLAPQLKKDFPQLRICIAGDSLYACGPVIQTCEDYRWKYVFTFKSGRTPALWKEFQALKALCPENQLHRTPANDPHQEFDWVNRLSYQDSDNREHTFDAIECTETDGATVHHFAWITNFHVASCNVTAISQKGGRNRWKIENQGFNTQKNGGYNLEHAYSFAPANLKAFYYLMQIAHMIHQLLEAGSLLRNLARKAGKTIIQLFGSIRNIARRLLDCFRYMLIPQHAYDAAAAAHIQIRLDTS